MFTCISLYHLRVYYELTSSQLPVGLYLLVIGIAGGSWSERLPEGFRGLEFHYNKSIIPDMLK